MLKNDLKQAKDRYWVSLMLNVGISLLFISVITGISVSLAPTYSNKAWLSEPLMIASTLKSEITTEFSMLGHWPKYRALEINNTTVIDKAIFDGNGTINLYLNDQKAKLSNKVLSFSAAINSSSSMPSVIWVCGNALPPEPFTLIGKNITNIDPINLPNACR